MLLLHAQTDETGFVTFGGETPSAADGSLAPAAPEQVAEAMRPAVWYSRELYVAGGRVATSGRNLFMFLSDVVGARFREGLFLGEDVLALAAEFRRAAALVAVGRALPNLAKDADGKWRARWFLADRVSPFADRAADALQRFAGRSALESHTGRFETAEDAWLAALRDDDADVRWDGEDDLAQLAERVAAWRAPVEIPDSERAALKFRLAPPASAEGKWRLVLDALPKTRAGMTALGQAADAWEPIRHLRAAADAALALDLTLADCETFLRVGANALEGAGYGVEIPDGMRGEHVAAEAELAETNAPKDDAAPVREVSAKLTIRVDGEKVTEDEIVFLLDQNSPLVFFRDRWIEVDRAVLREALRALRGTKGRKLTLREAAAFALGTARAGSLRVSSVTAFGRLKSLLGDLTGENRFRVLPQPKGLVGELRDYQLRGFSFLDFLAAWGFGACLADDMGLGKTVQAIAFLLRRRERSERVLRRPSLVVAPVSVTTNWMRELRRFAPSLKAMLHLGPERLASDRFARAAAKMDVVVTGYSLLTKDFALFNSTPWDALVLDEAQRVKNPTAQVSVAARAIARSAAARIALTGTPVENGPADLWSLGEFLNPGLLGTRVDFLRDVARPGASARLRRITGPFLLRRLKTDPAIAAAIGSKREVREYCALTSEQRREYEDALSSYRADMKAEVGSASRRGRILALLTELKHVCGGEGKRERLAELLDETFAAGESALVFTQYAEKGAELRAMLQERFGRRVPFLHGALTPAQREREIEAFNSSPEPTAFVLSLRAGGFGLNLTRATHVIHYDRWWNPAVENQATDRAHRLGQSKDVFVHLFICAGTLEDRIDALLESKRSLAGELVGSGENLLLKMSDDEFERTVALGE